MDRATPRVRVIAVGQTPPPVGGQALAMQSFVSGEYETLELFHVRMAFSAQTADIGKPQVSKIAHLAGLIVRILWRRFRTGATVLYYPPAGPDMVPVLRDIVVLLATRWAFRSTVFHFHASGVSELEPRLRWPLRALYRAAYGGADLAIQTSELNPPDGTRLGARRVVVVANGVPDQNSEGCSEDSAGEGVPSVLYVGVLRESKGLLVLAEACELLVARGVEFRLALMGAFDSAEFESELRAALADAGMAERTRFLGVLGGEEKAECFRQSSVFCYPTHFESESFGIVLIEAMQFCLPVAATKWRGVPSVVDDGTTGLLVPPQDPRALADALQTLITEPEMRRRMGARGRAAYLERFTLERYRRTLEAALGAL